jgi:hypothetical protein
MTANSDLILAGIAGGGTGSALSWFAPTGTTAPTTATAALAAGFLDAGWCTEDGVTRKVSEDSTDVAAFGSTVPVRVLVTKAKFEFSVGFLEANAVSLCVYNRLPLGGLTISSTGATDFTEGTHRVQKYAAVFDVVDGLNHIRCYCPSVEVTDREDFSIKAGAVIQYGVTLTAYPNSAGVAAHWYYVLNALAA